MSRLKDLIQELCPDGVKYRPLGEVATEMYRGAGIKREEVSESGYPCIRYGEIHTTYKIWFDKCVSHTDESIHPSKKYAEYGDILFAITSEDVENVGNSVAYVGNEKILVGGDIVVMKHNQNPKYLAYALSTTDAVKQKGKGKVKSKVVHTSVPSLQEIEIPVPTMAVQEEIVRILDKFSDLQIQLQNELQAELQKRLQQYTYYRDKLLSFSDIGGNVKWLKLGDVAEYFTGLTYKPSDVSKTLSGTIVLRSSNIKQGQLDFTDSVYVEMNNIPQRAIVKEGDILICVRNGSRSLIGKSCLIPKIDKEMAFGAFMTILRAKNNINNHFLYYCWQSQIIQRQIQGNDAMPINQITGRDLANITIPVPPISEQERIVAILDRFDTLCTDLTTGIPAEIEGRRKQYEYYRDQLLTFKAKS